MNAHDHPRITSRRPILATDMCPNISRIGPAIPSIGKELRLKNFVNDAALLDEDCVDRLGVGIAKDQPKFSDPQSIVSAERLLERADVALSCRSPQRFLSARLGSGAKRRAKS